MKKELKLKNKYQNEILEICNMKHLTAEDILEKLKKKNPKAGQATVYRTIKKMTDIGLLNKISGGNNKNYYEKNNSFHGHFISDGEIRDFDLPKKFLEEIEKKVGKKIKAIDLKVFV